MTSHPAPRGLSRRTVLTATALAPALAAAPALTGPALAQQATGAGAYERRIIGDIEVIALFDGTGTFPTGMLPAFEAEAGRKAAAAAYKPFDPEQMQIAINGYVIRSGDRVIAVDAGAPKPMGESSGNWRDSLAMAGIAPEEIDTIFLTHPHIDHVGGLSSEAGERFLPNAGLILSETDWAFAHDDSVLAFVPEPFVPMFHAARSLMAPYAEGREMLSMASETEIAPGVTAVPLPGHTPGHMALRVESGGEALLIWGDLIHAPAFQFAHPDWSMVFDADQDVAGETRARMLDAASADGLLVAGMHLDFPALGHVERQGDAYRYVAAPRDYRA